MAFNQTKYRVISREELKNIKQRGGGAAFADGDKIIIKKGSAIVLGLQGWENDTTHKTGEYPIFEVVVTRTDGSTFDAKVALSSLCGKTARRRSADGDYKTVTGACPDNATYDEIYDFVANKVAAGDLTLTFKSVKFDVVADDGVNFIQNSISAWQV